MLCFYDADLSESCTDDAADDSTASSPQKGKLLIDSTYESSTGTATEVEKAADESTSDTDIALDWSELAGLSSGRKSQTSRATKVIFSQVMICHVFTLKIFAEILQKHTAFCWFISVCDYPLISEKTAILFVDIKSRHMLLFIRRAVIKVSDTLFC